MRGFVARAAVLPFSVLASCSSTETTPGTTGGSAEYVSGTRLHAQVYAVGAAKVWHDWYDTQLKVQCAYRDADDGSVRCLPSGPSVASAYLFADAACTTRVAVAEDGCAAPVYASVMSTGPGCSKNTVATVGAVYTGSTYQMSSDGTCTPITAGANTKLYSVGATVPTSTFVSSSRKTEARGAVLSVNVEHGDDGSSRVLEMYDTVLAGPCRTIFEQQDQRLPEYVDRCVPARTGFREGDFGDGACGTPVAYVPGAACTKDVRNAVEVYGPISATCLQEALLGFAQIGAVYTGDVYRKDTATCQKSTNTQPTDGYASIGAPMPGSAMPKVTHLREGTDRIVKDWFVDDVGHKLQVAGLYDTQRKEPCFVTVTTDGKMRCAPQGNGGASAFTDAACTKALFAAYAPQPTCPAEPMPKVLAALVSPGTCQTPGKQRYYTVGGPVSPAEIYSISNEKCQGPVASGTATYYDTTEIAPDGFAELSDVTE